MPERYPTGLPTPAAPPAGSLRCRHEPARRALETIDLSSFDFWVAPREERDGAFKTLRDEAPVRFFHEIQFEGSPIPPRPGYWALTRYEDVWQASRNPKLFCSGRGSNIADLPQEMMGR